MPIFKKDQTLPENYGFEKENWKPVEYNNAYSVSDMGRVKRGDHFLCASIDSYGYFVVTLFNGRERKMFKVHRLVAIHFLDNPGNLPVVNHKNTIKTYNFVTNLEWCSVRENNAHKFKSTTKTSKYTGVSFHKRQTKSPWVATIEVDKKSIHLGSYATEKEAQQAYLQAHDKYNINNKHSI